MDPEYTSSIPMHFHNISTTLSAHAQRGGQAERENRAQTQRQLECEAWGETSVSHRCNYFYFGSTSRDASTASLSSEKRFFLVPKCYVTQKYWYCFIKASLSSALRTDWKNFQIYLQGNKKNMKAVMSTQSCYQFSSSILALSPAHSLLSKKSNTLN